MGSTAAYKNGKAVIDMRFPVYHYFKWNTITVKMINEDRCFRFRESKLETASISKFNAFHKSLYSLVTFKASASVCHYSSSDVIGMRWYFTSAGNMSVFVQRHHVFPCTIYCGFAWF